MSLQVRNDMLCYANVLSGTKIENENNELILLENNNNKNNKYKNNNNNN